MYLVTVIFMTALIGSLTKWTLVGSNGQSTPEPCSWSSVFKYEAIKTML